MVVTELGGQGVPKDFVVAYMSLTLAGMHDPEAQKNAKNLRDATVVGMTPAQIAETQKMVRELNDSGMCRKRRITAAGSGDRSPSDRATLGQYLVNCLFRVGSRKGAAGEDEIFRVTRSTTSLPCSRESEGKCSRTSTSLLIFMLSNRKLGSGALRLVTSLSASATI
jgi:hypothetical protein